MVDGQKVQVVHKVSPAKTGRTTVDAGHYGESNIRGGMSLPCPGQKLFEFQSAIDLHVNCSLYLKLTWVLDFEIFSSKRVAPALLP